MLSRNSKIAFRIAFVAVVSLTLAFPAAAGIHYRATTTIDPEQGKDQVTQVEAWVDGGFAKILFGESDQPLMPKGTYLLTRDAGKTLYLVDPKEKTYSRWDLEAMLASLGQIIEGLGGLVDLEFSDPEVATLGSAPGPEILGYPTTHAKFQTAYTVKVKVLGMKRDSRTETIQEVWTTDAFGDPALGIWLRKEPPKTGNEGIDRLIAAEIDRVQGFPLKTVAVATTVGGKRGQQTSTSRTETVVTMLEETAVPGSTFELPAGYKETQMTGAEEDNPLGGIFGRRKDGR